MIERSRNVSRACWALLLAGSAALALGAGTATAAQERAGAESVRGADRAVARALRDEARGDFRDFYAAREFRPLWVSDGALNEATFRFLEIVDSAAADGLDPGDYALDHVRRLIARTEGADAEALAEAELELSRAFVRLVQDMRRPRIEMHYAEEAVRPGRLDDAEVLRRAGEAGSFPEYVANLGWMHPLYTGLRRQLAALGEPAGRPRVEIPTGPTLREGDGGARVALLRRRLGLADGEQFDADLARAVRAFQQAHGIAADGVVGPRTLAALNGGAGGTSREVLQVNLERARLLPDAATKHVVVNAASAELAYYDAGAQQGAMKVVVGTAKTPTPMMAGMIRYATLNPYWNLPVDLAASLIAPRMLAGNSLKAMGYEVLSDWTAEAQVVDPKTIDWRRVASGDETVRVRQLPGPGNSMGAVKFMFPNDLGIFLHDTPNRELFKRAARQFSNGCVRLEDAHRLGRWLFGEDLTPESDAPEQYRHLPQPVPVYLTYLTAVPDGTSLAHFPDVYGRDSERAAQLARR